jgi:adenylate cyclase class 2
MYEVELKLPADLAAVRSRLEDLGATRTCRLAQVDTYYDAPHREFAETDEALRVRHERRVNDPGNVVRRGDWDEEPVETSTHLTYKGPLVDDTSKTRREFETRVADAEALGAILESLGFEPAATVEKDRECYAVDGYVVTLDDVDGLDEYVEVEREVPEAEVDDARDGAREVVSQLGLDPDDQVRTAYLVMVLDDGEDSSE